MGSRPHPWCWHGPLVFYVACVHDERRVHTRGPPGRVGTPREPDVGSVDPGVAGRLRPAGGRARGVRAARWRLRHRRTPGARRRRVVGAAPRLRDRGAAARDDHTRPPSLPAIGLVALVAVTALGLTYTESDERTVDELARVLHYGGVVALVVSLVDARTWRYAAAGLTSGAVLVSLLALGSRLFPDLFPADAVDQVFPSSRQQYPLSYWNGVAAFTAMTAVLALGLSAHARSRAGRVLALAAVPAVLAVTYLTYARGGIVAVGRRADRARDPRPSPRAARAARGGRGGRRAPSSILVIRGQPEIARGTGPRARPWCSPSASPQRVVCAAAVLATGALGRGTPAAAPQPAGARARHRHRRGRPGRSASRSGRVSSTRRSTSSEPRRPPSQSSDPAARLATLGSARYGVWGRRSTSTPPSRCTAAGRGRSSSSGTAAPLRGVRPRCPFVLPREPRRGGLARPRGGPALPRRSPAGRERASASAHVAIRVDAGYLGALLACFVVYLAYAGYDWMWELTAVSVFGLVAASIAIGSAGSVRVGGLDWRVAFGPRAWSR